MGVMAQGYGNGLKSDAFAVTKSPRTDSGSESHENVDPFFLGDTGEELIEFEVGAPFTPVLPVCSLALAVLSTVA
jgi:hypothetical protein